MNEQLVPQTAPHRPGPAKPGKVTAIAVLSLVDGGLNILFGVSLLFFFVAFGFSTLGCGCLLAPLALYPLVLGILEVVYAARLLPEPPQPVRPARWLAIMQILNVLLGNVLSLVVGVLELVFFDDPEVRAWYQRMAPPEDRWGRPGAQATAGTAAHATSQPPAPPSSGEPPTAPPSAEPSAGHEPEAGGEAPPQGEPER